MNDEEYYYIKKGRRYIPVEPFRGFHADGIWLVKDEGRSNALIMRLPDVPVEDIQEYALKMNLYALIQEAAKDYLKEDKHRYQNLWDVGFGIADLVMKKINEG